MTDSSRHILKSFDAELQQLRSDVITMGKLASRSMEQAVNGLVSGNIEECSDVIAEDEVVDQQEKRIDEAGMAILLRFTPMASDLRMVVSSLNICRSVERIADHSVNIAKRARKILKEGSIAEVRLVEPLFEEAHKVVSAALLAYADVDGVGALKVVEMDREVDRIHKRLAKTLTGLASDPDTPTEKLLHLLFIGRSLERIADLAVNIAEDLFFITSAEDIRHS